MDIKELEKDKDKLQKLLQQAQINVWRYEGALGYVLDNINKLKET